MPRLTQDRRLLDAFRSGEREALEEVYRHYAPGVAAVLRHGFQLATGGARFQGIPPGAELENGVQEVFTRAFAPEARARYDGLRPYGAYLAAVARNWAINEARRARPTELLDELPQDADPSLAEPVVTPETEALDGELVALLGRFRAGLDPLSGRLFELRFERGLGQEAAASELGKSRIQLRRLERRLKGRLLGYLKQAGYLEGASPRLWGAAARKGARP
ncbi:MAG: RNA polymerase sigma factor [Deltaproteobacteria bacterium]